MVVVEEQIRTDGRDDPESTLAALRDHDVVAGVADERLQCLEHLEIVVDAEDQCRKRVRRRRLPWEAHDRS